MQADKVINEEELTELHIVVSYTDAELLQTAVLQFAEKWLAQKHIQRECAGWQY